VQLEPAVLDSPALPNVTVKEFLQESCAVAREPHDAAAVVFGLKFADNIHYPTSSRVAKLRKPGFRAPNVPAQNRI